MADLIPLSPLMQPVEWQGQIYFTSQYFHLDYIANSPDGGKHRQHKNFIRVIRAIPAYHEYLTKGDIVEISWDRIKTEAAQNLSQWKPLFEATGYQPLTLLNATGQSELSHHLEDEASKQMAVASSTAIARQATSGHHQSALMQETSAVLRASLEICELLGLPTHRAQQEAVKLVAQQTGINLNHLLLAAPAQQNIPDEDKMLEPRDLAKALGFASGMLLNQHLHAIGWQIPRIGGGWEATPAGKPYCMTHAWTAGNKSGYNYCWNIEAVKDILKTRNLLPKTPPQQEQLPI
jgi:hypothetical protein